jgi:hypothetical protein
MTNNQVTVSREQQLLHKVVIVNGFPGCGKTMLSPIISAFDRVEIMQHPFLIEQMCELNSINRIDNDVAESMIKMNADLLIYNVMMGRQTNCRPSDLSSIFKHKPFMHIKRMLNKGDSSILKIIEEKKPILNLTTHMLLASTQLLFKALKEKLIFIELVRHPLYMIIQHEMNFNMFEGPRNQHTRYLYKNKEHNFFAYGYEEKFEASNSYEKAIFSIDWYYSKLFSKDYDSSVEVVPFERFVKYPDEFISKFSSILESPFNKSVKKEMIKQRVPRKLVSDGIPLEIYKRYGWQPSQTNNEQEELNIRRELISKKISKEALSLLDKMSKEYEDLYGSI